MRQRQESCLTMYLATIDFCKQNKEVISTLPNFDELISELSGTCRQIRLMAQQQIVNDTGVTETKTELRNNLVRLLINTTRKLCAYARLSNNKKLLKEVDYSESDLRRQPDTTLVDIAQLVYQRAEQNMDDLAEYQFNEENRAALLQAISEYNNLLTSPRYEQANRKIATQQLDYLFTKGQDIVNKMDVLVEIIRDNESGFYTGYRSVRKVICTGASRLALKGKIVDQLTGDPIKGVKVSFWLDGDPKRIIGASEQADLMKKSAEHGGFQIKSLKPGTYRAMLKKEGYNDQQVVVYVNEGERTDMQVGMNELQED